MTAMPSEDFEAAYETLAVAIDSAGPEHEALFLTRLALLLATRQVLRNGLALIGVSAPERM